MKNISKFIQISSICCLLLPATANAQLMDRLKNAVKNKLEDRAQRKVEETVDKGADEMEKAIKKKNDSAKVAIKTEQKKAAQEKELPKESKTTTPTKQVSPSITINSSSNFEFVSGAVPLYTEDFSKDKLDELPLKWSTDHKGVVVELSGLKGKWMKMAHSSQYMSPTLSKPLPDNYTIEFDMLMNLKYDGYFFPTFKFKLIENVMNDADGRKYMRDISANSIIPAIEVMLSPGNDESSEIAFQSSKKDAIHFQNEGNKLANLSNKFGKVVRVSIWVQKQRMRLWIDETKVYDVPQAIPDQIALNRVALQIASSIQPDSEIGFYLSNLRIATAGADIRNKLINEGNFSTNGILFDTNSDRIKSESATILKELAQVLKETPSLKVLIVGHTDNEGDEKNNLELSKKRSLAVKNSLMKEYGIDAARMLTDGQGETSPVASNENEAGKSLNRRVEFKKL